MRELFLFFENALGHGRKIVSSKYKGINITKHRAGTNTCLFLVICLRTLNQSLCQILNTSFEMKISLSLKIITILRVSTTTYKTFLFFENQCFSTVFSVLRGPNKKRRNDKLKYIYFKCLWYFILRTISFFHKNKGSLNIYRFLQFCFKTSNIHFKSIKIFNKFVNF